MTSVRKRPTRRRAAVLADVARLASVSQQTVSRALRGRGPIRRETRERVLAAALQLKYQPNPLARALASGRSRLLGAVTLRLTCGSRAFIDFEQAARRADYSVCVTTLDEPCEASVSTAVEHLRRHGAAGLAIIAPCTLPLPAARLLAQVVPIRLVKNGRAGTAGARALIRDIEGIVATDPQCIDTLSSD